MRQVDDSLRRLGSPGPNLNLHLNQRPAAQASHNPTQNQSQILVCQAPDNLCLIYSLSSLHININVFFLDCSSLLGGFSFAVCISCGFSKGDYLAGLELSFRSFCNDKLQIKYMLRRLKQFTHLIQLQQSSPPLLMCQSRASPTQLTQTHCEQQAP